jgi:hypothetical protein
MFAASSSEKPKLRAAVPTKSRASDKLSVLLVIFLEICFVGNAIVIQSMHDYFF